MVDDYEIYDGERAYTEQQAAEFIGRAVGTLRRYRAYNTKPHFVKRGWRVLYKEGDLLNYLAGAQDIPQLLRCLRECIEGGRDPDGTLAKWRGRLCHEHSI